MRLLLAALLVVLPSIADAQTSRSDASGRSQPPPPPSNSLPLPPIGLPLPDITPTLAPIGTLPGTDRDEVLAQSRSQSPAPSAWSASPGSLQPGRHLRRSVWLGPAGGCAGPGASPTAEVAEATGTLWLDIEPRGLGKVYIDGYLAGTTHNVRGSITLDAGAHRVEVRAEGYRPVGVEVRIEAGGAVTLRRTLQPLPAAPEPPVAGPPALPAARPAAAAPIPRKPFYYIPGCYLGDVPPQRRRPSGHLQSEQDGHRQALTAPRGCPARGVDAGQPACCRRRRDRSSWRSAPGFRFASATESNEVR